MRQLVCLQTTLSSQILINLRHALHREVNLDLNNLQNEVLPNQLSLNVLKTEYMYFASDYNLSNLGIFKIDPLKIGEELITRVQSSKSRGVVFVQCLVWEEHVDSLCKRVPSGLAALKQARQYVPQNASTLFFFKQNSNDETPKAPKSSGQNYNPKGSRCKVC